MPLPVIRPVERARVGEFYRRNVHEIRPTQMSDHDGQIFSRKILTFYVLTPYRSRR